MRSFSAWLLFAMQHHGVVHAFLEVNSVCTAHVRTERPGGRAERPLNWTICTGFTHALVSTGLQLLQTLYWFLQFQLWLNWTHWFTQGFILIHFQVTGNKKNSLTCVFIKVTEAFQLISVLFNASGNTRLTLHCTHSLFFSPPQPIIQKVRLIQTNTMTAKWIS